jgi:hypothetical protein
LAKRLIRYDVFAVAAGEIEETLTEDDKNAVALARLRGKARARWAFWLGNGVKLPKKPRNPVGVSDFVATGPHKKVT